MKLQKVTGICILVWVIILSMTAQSPVAAPESDGKPSEAQDKEVLSSPGLANFIPLVTGLADRQAALERNIAGLFDASAAEKRISKISKNLENLSGRLDRLKSTARYGYDQLHELKVAIVAERDSLKAVTGPLAQAVSQLESWKQEWLEEKKRLDELRSSLSQDVPPSTLKPLMTKADKSLETALMLISQQLQQRLAEQLKAGDIEAGLDLIEDEVSGLLLVVRRDIKKKTAPSMLSSEYYSLYNKTLWDQLRAGLSSISWPGRQFFALHGWKVCSQGLLALGAIFGLLHYRRRFDKDEKWLFLFSRPVAVGIFLSVWAVGPFYGPGLPVWSLFLSTIASVAAARLLGSFIPDPGRRKVIYGLAILVITFQIFQIIVLPLPVFRLYVFSVAMVGFFLSMWRARESSSRGDSALYTWALRLTALVLIVVAMAELGGYSAFAAFVLESYLKTIFLGLLSWLLVVLVESLLKMALHSPRFQKIKFLGTYAAVIVGRSMLLVGLVVGTLFVTYVLVIWRAYDSPLDALRGAFSLGFGLGTSRITIGLVFMASCVLYGAFVISWAVQAVLMDQVFPRLQIQTGIRISMARLVHYALVFVGFILALTALGLDLKNITIIGGALGVGIGFGLQGVVNNFVSGIILLFERPIKVGDYVQLGEQWGEIKNIGLRATIVETFDKSEIVVPNADLITNQITNWTLSHRLARVTIPVGVAYGSDVPLVFQTLMDCAMASSKVLRMPAPQVLFMAFGESSLDFQLRVWMSDIDERLPLQSALHQEIDRRFREAGIEISFPQRDLHLRSVEEIAATTLQTSKGTLSA